MADNNPHCNMVATQNLANIAQEAAPAQSQTPQKRKRANNNSKKKEPLAMDTIELPVNENYGRANWGKYEGVREWISNWFDECRVTDKNPKVTKTDSDE